MLNEHEVQELLSSESNRREERSCGDTETEATVSVDEALNTLQQSKENAAETITKVFKACHDGLNRFKQTALENLSDVSDNANDILECELKSKDEVVIGSVMPASILYGIDSGYSKDVNDIINKYFIVNTLPFAGNSNDSQKSDCYYCREPQKKHQKLNDDNSAKAYLKDILSLFKMDNEKIEAISLMKNNYSLFSK